MAEMYLQIKHAHMLFVALTLFFFNTKFWLQTAKPSIKLPVWFTWTSHLNDSMLLLMGMMMMSTIKFDIFGPAKWLGIKFLLIVAYVVIGMVCIKSQPRSKKSAITYVLAMATISIIIYLARNKPAF